MCCSADVASRGVWSVKTLVVTLSAFVLYGNSVTSCYVAFATAESLSVLFYGALSYRIFLNDFLKRRWLRINSEACQHMVTDKH